MKHVSTQSAGEGARAPRPTLSTLKPTEHWRQDPVNPDLWHGASGVIVNGAALAARTFYFEVVRLTV